MHTCTTLNWLLPHWRLRLFYKVLKQRFYFIFYYSYFLNLQWLQSGHHAGVLVGLEALPGTAFQVWHWGNKISVFIPQPLLQFTHILSPNPRVPTFWTPEQLGKSTWWMKINTLSWGDSEATLLLTCMHKIYTYLNKITTKLEHITLFLYHYKAFFNVVSYSLKWFKSFLGSSLFVWKHQIFVVQLPVSDLYWPYLSCAHLFLSWPWGVYMVHFDLVGLCFLSRNLPFLQTLQGWTPTNLLPQYSLCCSRPPLRLKNSCLKYEMYTSLSAEVNMLSQGCF